MTNSHRGSDGAGRRRDGDEPGDALARALELLSGIGESEPEERESQGGRSQDDGEARSDALERENRRPGDGGGNGTRPRHGTDGSQRERRRPERPTRPLYTLQEVHELTDVPYAKLALYAAQHAPRIPSAGERYAPAYPREGVMELCRIHAEHTPGWEIPELGPEPGWDDEAGLSARLAALESSQRELAAELRSALGQVRRRWQGEARWA